ncbi:MAG TPA: hypothetical protein VGM78_07060, partial [Ilumatobacteraceae bacterium]
AGAAANGATTRLVPWPGHQKVIDIGSFATDSTRIATELGWTAQIALADGVGRTLAFYRERPWYLSST